MFINHNKTYINHTIPVNQWYIIDAKNKTLGRLSSQVAYLLQDKNSITYLPYQKSIIDIIIINSKLIYVTGKKRQQKIYRRHSGRPGGLKTENFQSLNLRLPNRILEKSIKGMLPRNKTKNKLLTKFRIYSDNKHPHTAQKPIQLN